MGSSLEALHSNKKQNRIKKNPKMRAVSCIEEEAMSLSVFYYCICDFPHHCYRFKPTSCHLSPFHLSYAAVSSPSCPLSE